MLLSGCGQSTISTPIPLPRKSTLSLKTTRVAPLSDHTMTRGNQRELARAKNLKKKQQKERQKNSTGNVLSKNLKYVEPVHIAYQWKCTCSLHQLTPACLLCCWGGSDANALADKIAKKKAAKEAEEKKKAELEKKEARRKRMEAAAAKANGTVFLFYSL